MPLYSSDALSIVSIFAFVSYLKLLEKVGPGRAGYVGVVMPVLALIISTIFVQLPFGSASIT